MSTPVFIDRQPDGWVLVTADDARSVLVGPADESTVRELAIDLDYQVISLAPKKGHQKKALVASDMPIGYLFHAGDSWYRMIGYAGKFCEVEVVGAKRNDKIPSTTPVIEISVMSKR